MFAWGDGWVDGWMELESLEIHLMLKIDENFYLGVKYILSDFFPSPLTKKLKKFFK